MIPQNTENIIDNSLFANEQQARGGGAVSGLQRWGQGFLNYLGGRGRGKIIPPHLSMHEHAAC